MEVKLHCSTNIYFLSECSRWKQTKTNFYFKAYIFGPNPRAIIKSKQIILSNAKAINGCLKIKSSFKDFKVIFLARVQDYVETSKLIEKIFY